MAAAAMVHGTGLPVQMAGNCMCMSLEHPANDQEGGGIEAHQEDARKGQGADIGISSAADILSLLPGLNTPSWALLDMHQPKG